MMRENNAFWEFLEHLVAACPLVIDRPKGSTHPRYPGRIYPLDYGYLEGSSTLDGGGVDVWVGSLSGKPVSGALATVDLVKRDTELKILVGCTEAEMAQIVAFVNGDQFQSCLMRRGGQE